MYALLIVIHVLSCLILIAVILLQAGKGGGLAETFGGGGGFQTIFGTKTSKFLTRATAIFAIAFLVTSLSLAMLSAKRGTSLIEKEAVTQEKVKPAETKQATEPQPQAETTGGEQAPK